MRIFRLLRSILSLSFSAAALALFLVAAASSLRAQRLPQTVRPESYTLSLTPDLKAATFSGVETIELTIAEPTKRITLNAAEIAFQSVSVAADGKRQTGAVSLDAEKEQATLSFPEKLPVGKATLSISYTGILNDKLRGFYLSKTARRNYAVSQFESTDARRAFPSFDEPALKATFDVSLVVDAGDTAISNGPIVSDTPGPIAGKHTLKFLATPRMSTYLVAFLVGDFQCSAGESDGVAIRVCSTPDKVALTPFSVEFASKVLHYYNNYFGIPYPLKKLDLIALPDFEAGAMENFGAITYRETDLLLDEKTASVGAKRRVAVVVAHEMAHQWFGDLVTMQWWDNLWLNEGFATWMENKAVAAQYPEWKMEQIVASDAGDTLNLDAQPTTRPIRAKADTPEEIDQMFDGIAYGKAGAVLQSVENYLGEETFRQGVHNYLAAHLYANATAEDFWGAQTANSHKPVDRIMESLVVQPGVPLLTFGEPANGTVPVSQRRFFVSPNIHGGEKQKWTLPVCFKTETGQDCQVLTPADSSLKIPAGRFFANAGGNGYYRSAYPASVYASLVAGVESSLTPVERISLIGDEWAEVRADMAPVGDYLDLVAAVKSDSNATVLEKALQADPNARRMSRRTEGLQSVYQQIAGNPEEKAALSAWIRANFSPQLAKLGSPSASDSDSVRELRAKLFTVLGLLGKDPAVLAEARRIADRYLTEPSTVDGTLGEAALTVAARYGDAALYDRLQQVYESSANPVIQQAALRHLARFENPVLAERALNYAIGNRVRNQDATDLFRIGLQSEANRELAWKFIQSHWEQVHAQLTVEAGAHLVDATDSFCSTAARNEVKSFFASHTVAATDMYLKHAMERIDACSELRSLQEPKLRQWIAAQPKQ
jgi:aminopeptidase N